MARSALSSLAILGLALLTGACVPSRDRDGADDGDGGGSGGTTGGNGSGVAAPFFLPTGEPDNTAAPSVEVDAEGGIHAVYPVFAGGGAYYAYCASDCAGPEDVSVVALATDGSVDDAMIALDVAGRPQLLLSTFHHVYYAVPSGDFRDAASWQVADIVDHDGKLTVTGEALALDPQGRPRFLMHTPVAYLGVGQKPPETWFASCDDGCLDPNAWTGTKIADEIWQANHLRYDATGVAHLAASVRAVQPNGSIVDLGAYARCDGDCADGASWQGTGLLPAFANELDAVAIRPAISLALGEGGVPRIALLAADELDRNVVYLSCDSGCTSGDAWSYKVLVDAHELGAGIDLALDAAGSPRLVFTQSYTIGLAHCEGTACEAEGVGWTIDKVEGGGDMEPDATFLWGSCNVGAWFLHSPSIALDAQGRPRVGYQARDISAGGGDPHDPNDPGCPAGTDMSWARIALMAAR